MVGSYHQFGTFISGVATLPRVVILTMHDVSLRPQAGSTPGGAKPALTSGTLALEGTVKTYRYVEDDETPTGTPGAPAIPAAPGTPRPAAPAQPAGHGGGP
jgi:type IV pilus assembly protein PilO